MLLTITETLKEENDRLSAANHQLRTQCESHKASTAAFFKILVSCSWRVGQEENQV